MKKIYLKSLFTFLLLLCSIMSSAHDFEFDGIYYNFTITGAGAQTVEVTYKGSYYYEFNNEYSGTVTIPATVTYDGDTYRVTSIGTSAFNGCTNITNITIPNSVTSIGISAFNGCTNITNITIPNSVTVIGASAFYDCTGLANIAISNSITGIEPYTFYRCSLTNVVLGNNIRNIGSSAFMRCSELRSITIPGSITTMEDNAFSGCVKLKTVCIGDLSAWCNIDFKSGDSNPLHNGSNLCLNGDTITDLIIPDDVTVIGNHTFDGCTGLNSVSIHNNITNIGADAFYGCSSLTAVHIKNLSAWCNINFETPLSNPLWNKANIYLNGKIITSLKIPDDITAVKDYAFYNCSSIASVTIPDNVHNIGQMVFTYCSNLEEIEIADNVQRIGEFAFEGCSSLTAVNIKNLSAWCNINFETPLSNPLHCASLYLNGNMVTNLIIPDDITAVKDYAFYNYRNLISVTIPNNVTSIGNNAFRNCSGLTRLTIDEGTALDNRLRATGVDDGIIFVNGLSTIGAYAFNGCTALAGELTIPHSVTTINNHAFSSCENLTGVTIGDGVTVIGVCAFNGCESITNVVMGESVANIRSQAFYDCDKIVKVNVKNEIPPTFYDEIFTPVIYTSATLYVPIGTKTVYQADNSWKKFTNIVEINNSLQGDVNIDGSIDVSDVTKLVAMILDASISTTSGDINGDGSIDISDVTKLVSIILGL